MRPLVPVRFICIGLALWVAMTAPGSSAHAADGARKTIRFADVGWTDITATTAVAAEVLRTLGIESETQVLAVPVTFMGLKTGDIDVFLGNWMPTQTNDITPYLARNDFRDIGVNLVGALFTLAVPSYVRDAGVKSAADLAAHRDRFGGKIFGIEPGNDGSRIVLDMIKNDTYGLGKFQLVESSEQGMLTQVKSAVARKEWIVFFGWRPHPMNTAISMAYLEDPLCKWGPGGGASEVHTIVSHGFARTRPDLMPFFEHIRFDLEMENELMTSILEGKQEPSRVAREWVASHPERVAKWLAHVPGVRAGAGLNLTPAPEVARRKLPIGRWIAGLVAYLTDHFSGELRSVSEGVTNLIQRLVRAAVSVPVPLVIPLLFVFTYAVQRRLPLALGMVVGSLLIWNLGYWEATIQTLALVITASLISVGIGVPLGIAAARHPLLYTMMRPLLDTMQTIPTFVYLIPTLMLFGLGIVPGLLSTVIFAVPAAIRLTHLGITSVPRELIEAGLAFGARPSQVLFKIELPHAMPAILEGVSQTLMLSLSMVVIAALVGAEGLGTPVVRALNTVNVAQGFEAGLTIVIVAILLDRLIRRQPHPGAGA